MKAIPMILLALGLFAAGEDPKTDDAKKDQEKLQGTWTMSKLERDGEDLLQQAGAVEVVFKDDTYKNDFVAAKFKLDPSKTPKAIDVTYTEGNAVGQTFKGIYKLDGDTLTICRANDEKADRPTEFTSPAGSGKMLFVLKKK
ncbi:MAG TPA: DUF5004 domain-containing protein [Isosphaeraceae bacterium]|jgi:RNA polymerase sigma-70 factor (ECF subfamily)|nr:DUF5004 domain-containing protein [Isosphaeraceae bacterium]